MLRCNKGHYYDETKFMMCPYCGIFSEEEEPLTQKINDTSQKEPVLPILSSPNYTTGWLVCVKGKDMGKDYRIFAGNNFVGRDYGMDIRIESDEMVSRKNHCSVVYEKRERRFYIVPMENFVHLDGKLLNKAEEIQSGQEVTIGNTTLVFVAFCGKDRAWEE